MKKILKTIDRMHKGMYNTNIKIIKDSHDRQSEKIITDRQICKWGSRGMVQKENEHARTTTAYSTNIHYV